MTMRELIGCDIEWTLPTAPTCHECTKPVAAYVDGTPYCAECKCS